MFVKPLSNLDAKLRTSMRSEIARLHRRLDTTFVYVTHDQTEAMTMGDRIVVMKDGLIQQYDTPKVLYDTPCNLFVAGFIGSPGEDCSLLELVLQGMAADLVFSACRREGGLFFENGGVAVEHVFSLLSSGGSAAGKASEASEAAYGLLMSFYGSQSAGPVEGKRLPLVVEAALGIIRRDYAFLDGIGELAERLKGSGITVNCCHPGAVATNMGVDRETGFGLLLRQGGHSIQFVSEACGFTNANYFARVFRSAVGMNPAEYARRHSSEADRPHDKDLYVL